MRASQPRAQNELRPDGFRRGEWGPSLFGAEDDHPVGQIVGGESNRHSVAEDHSNAELSHATAELSPDFRPSISLDLELTTSEHIADEAIELDVVIALLIAVAIEIAPLLLAPLSAA